jgi:hypothetical protein
MRLFLHVCCIVMVAGLAPAFAQNATQPETAAPAAETFLAASSSELPPGLVGRISLVSGNVELRNSYAAGWAEAGVNMPVFTGEAVRTDGKARVRIDFGANAVGLAEGSEIAVANLRDGVTQIALSRGRIGLHLRQANERETVEVDIPQGGIWLTAPGRYDIEAGNDQPPRIAVFDGAAQFAGTAGDFGVGPGHVAMLAGSDAAAATEPAPADAFVNWCRAQDYDQTALVAPYYVSPNVTGLADLDAAGVWKIDARYGPVWFPTASEDWVPFRFGRWSWVAPWGWTWIDDQPWGFAPSHYGRWALIREHWAWVPGSFVAYPVYAPAIVAFLGTPGVGLSSEEGATAAWFPLAPGEAYWPSYARDVDYVRRLNRGSVADLDTIRLPANGEPPLEIFNEEFANRQYATAVTRAAFVAGRPVAPARIALPEQRLQDAPVLMASPQLAPAATERVARAATPAPVTRVASAPAPNAGVKSVRTASMRSRIHGQTVILRGGHLRAPSYAGLSRGRQMIVVHFAHPREGGGRRARG